MANIKDLFRTYGAQKCVVSRSLNDLNPGVESGELPQSSYQLQNEVEPYIDFSNPENFVFYGSAEQYYRDSFEYIKNEFPYDGSAKEKVEWELSGSTFDLFIYNKKYPRCTGYVTIGKSATGSAWSDGYATPSRTEYIYFEGGPHPAPQVSEGDKVSKFFPSRKNAVPSANYYNETSNQQSNLEINGETGIAVEFWLNKQSYLSASESHRQVILDVWNSASWADSGYGRFRVEISGSGDEDTLLPNFHVELLSGSSGFTSGQILDSNPSLIMSASSMTGSWTHFALSFVNDGNQMTGKLYQDGSPTYSVTTGSSMGLVTGSMIAQIGSLITSVSGAVGQRGYGLLSASLDEFRFWKTQRTAQQVGMNWFTQINGGTNTDVSYKYNAPTKYSFTNPVDLGIYYKFNEGITQITSTDRKVLDYSGRLSNGSWTGYGSVDDQRSTNSAIVEASASSFEYKDPILYGDHPDVISVLDSLVITGSNYDINNNASFYQSLPGWIRDEDIVQDGKTLLKLTQIIASYFDRLQLQIQRLPRLKDINYISSSFKPFPYAERLIDSTGLTSVELFEEAKQFEEIASRDDYRLFTEKLDNTKNRIYQNIYNNLVHIFKSKGTEKSFRNLIRCYGIGEELVKINLYGDEVTYDIKENFESTITRKRYVNFYNTGSFNASVYQSSSNSDTDARSFLSSSVNATYQGNTFEAEIFFPKRQKDAGIDNFVVPFTTSSLFGVHTAESNEDYDWFSADAGNFQVSIARAGNAPEKDGYFRLTSSAGGSIPLLTSSLIKNVYDNSKWNLAVRVRPSAYPWSAGVLGSTSSTYDVEFLGYNTVLDSIDNQFKVTGSISFEAGQNFLTSSKRVFVGAHRTNFTGSVLMKSDARISSVRYWYDYLDDKTLLAHAKDPSNFGRYHAGQNTFLNQYGNDFARQVSPVPQIETLALQWSFDQVTSSNADGGFTVKDYSSGSSTMTSSYGWAGLTTQYRHPGVGLSFPESFEKATMREYVYTAKQQPPEVLNSSDMVKVLSDSDREIYTADSRPIRYFFTVEKSMAAVISSEMIKLFATVLDFNNLIGEPVNRYRQNYKAMEKMRELFFRRVQSDTLDFEKFVDYFKWVDDSITVLILQLFPMSANFSNKIFTMIENHVLERSKYWNKFPTLEMDAKDPEAGLYGISEMLYPGRRGGAPIPNNATGSDCVWWHDRAERTNSDISSGDSTIDSQRDTYRDANDFRPSSSPPTLTDIAGVTPTQYEGSTFALRNFTKIYRFGVEEMKEVHGGSNFPRAKKVEYTHDAINFESPAQLDITASSISYERDCDDVIVPNSKNRLEYKLQNSTDIDGYTSGKGTLLAPFSMFSSSVASGYVLDITNNFRTNTDITNYHDDTYGDDKGVPLQGPFAEQYVGGRQHRHQGIVTSSTETSDTRAEAWNLNISSENISIQSRSLDQPRATYVRDEYAKRPVNIRNIKMTTGSSLTVLGNYMHDYEVVQTTGRTQNNRFFVDNQGFVPFYAASPYGDWLDFELPRFDSVTGSNKTVFVNRFAAPGDPVVSCRGALDLYAEEYSLWNNLNYRNLSVRKPLDFWFTQHCAQFGLTGSSSISAFDYDANASYHKVNRNPKMLAACEVQYDNWFVQHAIPRSAFQYSWITASVSKSACDSFGHYGSPDCGINNFSVPSGTTSTTASQMPFITASSYDFTDADGNFGSGKDFPVNFGSVLPYTGTFGKVALSSYKYEVGEYAPQWYDTHDVTITDNGTTVFTTKTNDGYDAGVPAHTRLIGNSSIEFRGRTGFAAFVGLNSHPPATVHFRDMEYCLLLQVLDPALGYGPQPLYVEEYAPDTATSHPWNIQFVLTGLQWSEDDIYRITRRGDKILYQRSLDHGRSFTTFHISNKLVNTVSANTGTYAGFRDSRELYVDVTLYGAKSSVRDLKVINETNLLTPPIAYVSGGTDIPQNVNAHFNNINGPYGYPSWKQTRTGENPVARYQRANNILTIGPSRVKYNKRDMQYKILKNNEINPLTITDLLLSRPAHQIQTLVEPPVTFKYRPLLTKMDSSMEIDYRGNPASLGAQPPLTMEGELRHTFCNNLYYFANLDWTDSNDSAERRNNIIQSFRLPSWLDNSPGVANTSPRPTQIHDILYKEYTQNTSINLKEMTYSEYIYPRQVNTGLNKIRSRVNYAEDAPRSGSYALADYGINGIDREALKRRSFWSNTW